MGNLIFVTGPLFSNRSKYINDIALSLRNSGYLVVIFSFSHFIKKALRECVGLTKYNMQTEKHFYNKKYHILIYNYLNFHYPELDLKDKDMFQEVNEHIENCRNYKDYTYNFTKCMQIIGTEGRKVCENIWAYLVVNYCVNNVNGFDYYIFDDLRYKNEYQYVRNNVPHEFVTVKRIYKSYEDRLNHSGLSEKLFAELNSHESEKNMENELGSIPSVPIFL